MTTIFGDTDWILKAFEWADSMIGKASLFIFHVVSCLILLYLVDLTPNLKRFVAKSETELGGGG